jgi:hypothetical protein
MEKICFITGGNAGIGREAAILSLVLVKSLKKVPVIGTIFGKACEPAYRKALIVVTLIMVFLLLYL